jgi:hypothetical protein
MTKHTGAIASDRFKRREKALNEHACPAIERVGKHPVVIAVS